MVLVAGFTATPNGPVATWMVAVTPETARGDGRRRCHSGAGHGHQRGGRDGKQADGPPVQLHDILLPSSVAGPGPSGSHPAGQVPPLDTPRLVPCQAKCAPSPIG